MGDVWAVVIAADNAPPADNVKNRIRNWYKRKGFGLSFYYREKVPKPFSPYLTQNLPKAWFETCRKYQFAL